MYANLHQINWPHFTRPLEAITTLSSRCPTSLSPTYGKLLDANILYNLHTTILNRLQYPLSPLEASHDGNLSRSYLDPKNMFLSYSSPSRTGN